MKKIFILFITSVAIIIAFYYGYRKIYPIKERIEDNINIPDNIKIDSIIIVKSQRRMTLLKDSKEIKSYSISLGRNPLGAKIKEGDKKTPEGEYKIDFKNEKSKYHLSLRISYPNERDKENARILGVQPGGDIMIHGLPNHLSFLKSYYLNNDWTDGCIAVTNEEIEEIWKSVDVSVSVVIIP